MTTNDTKAVTPGEAGQPLDQSEEDELAKAEAEANEAAKGEAEGESTPSTESAPENQTTSDEGETESEGEPVDGEASSDSGETSEETPSDEEFVNNLSPKAQKRFAQLSRKAKEAEKLKVENERLRAQVSTPKLPDLNLTDPRGKQSGNLPWENPGGEAGEEQVLTEEELNKRIATGVTKVIGDHQTANQFFSDVKDVEKEHPELNADHADFDESLAGKVSGWYESIAMTRTPNGGLIFKPGAPTFRAFVDEVMGIRAKASERGKQAVTNTVLRQAARNAVASSGASSTESGGEAIDQIKDPNTSLEQAEAIANKAAKG